jgi:hypothetical protein
MAGRCSERVPRPAASAAMAGEPSSITTAAARPQQEEAAAVASQALVPHDPHQGCERAHSGAGPLGAAGRRRPLLTVILPLGGIDRGGLPGQPPSARPRCW